MWYAKECKENGYKVSKKYDYNLEKGMEFNAWNPSCDYLGSFNTALEAFNACESDFTKQTQT